MMAFKRATKIIRMTIAEGVRDRFYGSTVGGELLARPGHAPLQGEFTRTLAGVRSKEPLERRLGQMHELRQQLDRLPMFEVIAEKIHREFDPEIIAVRFLIFDAFE